MGFLARGLEISDGFSPPTNSPFWRSTYKEKPALNMKHLARACVTRFLRSEAYLTPQLPR
jgi:hypothetical protein